MIILNFLSLKDIYKFKFLSKRFYEISFFSMKFKKFNRISHKLFDVNDYYNKFLYFLNLLLKELKTKFDFSTYLFLKYSFDELINNSLISNCLFHLFACPRTIFAKNNCLQCSRIYVKKSIDKPKNFSSISKLKFSYFFNSVGLSTACIDIIKQFEFNIFFDSLEQFEIVNSDRKRCLTTFVIQEHVQFILKFFEVQLRILINFFYSLIDTIPKNFDIFFLKQCFSFAHKFVVYCIDKINSDYFREIFEEVDYNDYHFIKVINKKFIDFCKKKYAN